MLADRADSQAERRLEHDHVRKDQEGEAQPDHQVEIAEYLLEEGAAELHRSDVDVGEAAEEAEVRPRDLRDVGGRSFGAVDVDEEIAGRTQREEVDSGPD